MVSPDLTPQQPGNENGPADIAPADFSDSQVTAEPTTLNSRQSSSGPDLQPGNRKASALPSLRTTNDDEPALPLPAVKVNVRAHGLPTDSKAAKDSAAVTDNVGGQETVQMQGQTVSHTKQSTGNGTDGISDQAVGPAADSSDEVSQSLRPPVQDVAPSTGHEDLSATSVRKQVKTSVYEQSALQVEPSEGADVSVPVRDVYRPPQIEKPATGSSGSNNVVEKGIPAEPADNVLHRPEQNAEEAPFVQDRILSADLRSGVTVFTTSPRNNVDIPPQVIIDTRQTESPASPDILDLPEAKKTLSETLQRADIAPGSEEFDVLKLLAKHEETAELKRQIESSAPAFAIFGMTTEQDGKEVLEGASAQKVGKDFVKQERELGNYARTHEVRYADIVGAFTRIRIEYEAQMRDAIRTEASDTPRDITLDRARFMQTHLQEIEDTPRALSRADNDPGEEVKERLEDTLRIHRIEPGSEKFLILQILARNYELLFQMRLYRAKKFAGVDEESRVIYERNLSESRENIASLRSKRSGRRNFRHVDSVFTTLLPDYRSAMFEQLGSENEMTRDEILKMNIQAMQLLQEHLDTIEKGQQLELAKPEAEQEAYTRLQDNLYAQLRGQGITPDFNGSYRMLQLLARNEAQYYRRTKLWNNYTRSPEDQRKFSEAYREHKITKEIHIPRQQGYLNDHADIGTYEKLKRFFESIHSEYCRVVAQQRGVDDTDIDVNIEAWELLSRHLDPFEYAKHRLLKNIESRGVRWGSSEIYDLLYIVRESELNQHIKRMKNKELRRKGDPDLDHFVIANEHAHSAVSSMRRGFSSKTVQLLQITSWAIHNYEKANNEANGRLTFLTEKDETGETAIRAAKMVQFAILEEFVKRTLIEPNGGAQAQFPYEHNYVEQLLRYADPHSNIVDFLRAYAYERFFYRFKAMREAGKVTTPVNFDDIRTTVNRMSSEISMTVSKDKIEVARSLLDNAILPRYDKAAVYAAGLDLEKDEFSNAHMQAQFTAAVAFITDLEAAIADRQKEWQIIAPREKPTFMEAKQKLKHFVAGSHIPVPMRIDAIKLIIAKEKARSNVLLKIAQYDGEKSKNEAKEREKVKKAKDKTEAKIKKKTKKFEDKWKGWIDDDEVYAALWHADGIFSQYKDAALVKITPDDLKDPRSSEYKAHRDAYETLSFNLYPSRANRVIIGYMGRRPPVELPIPRVPKRSRRKKRQNEVL